MTLANTLVGAPVPVEILMGDGVGEHSLQHAGELGEREEFNRALNVSTSIGARQFEIDGDIDGVLV